MALRWGWPYDIAEPGGTTHKRDAVEFIYETTKRSLKRYTELNGGEARPIVMSELIADGDVTGPYDQCEMVKEFADMNQRAETKRPKTLLIIP